jgi:hypothetical protein
MTLRAGAATVTRASFVLLALTSIVPAPLPGATDPQETVTIACESRPFLWDRIVGSALRCDGTSGQWVVPVPAPDLTPTATLP